MPDKLTEGAELQGELWSAAGRDWAELAAHPGTPLWGTSLDLARVTRRTRLLDIGCGSGEALVLGRFRGAAVAGIDAADELLDIARERLPSADIRRGDMAVLPYEEGSFDAVLHLNSIMYTSDQVQALEEAARVLDPDGRLVVAVWGREEDCEFRHVMKALLDVLPEKPPGSGPFTLSTPGALEALLETAGFEPVQVVELPGPFVYMDSEHYLGAALASGPAQGVIQQVGKRTVEDSLRSVGERFERSDGSYRIENTFKIAAATHHQEQANS